MFKSLLALLSLAAVAWAVTIPRPCGEVPFTVPGKGPMNLTSYYGKVILVAVFDTHCPYCQRTTKRLIQIQNDYRNQGLQVVELAFQPQDNAEAIGKFVEEYKPTYPVGMMDPNLLLKWGQLTSGINPRPTLPMLFFIDRNGYIQGEYSSSDPIMDERVQDASIRAKLKSLLDAPPLKAKAPGKK